MCALLAVVDNYEARRRGVVTYLRGHGYNVETSSSLAEGASLIVERRPSVAIVQVDRAGLESVRLCSDIRRTSDSATIMTVPCRDSRAAIAYLNAGADDVMTRPFDRRELLARVRGLQRRFLLAATPLSEQLEIGEGTLAIDTTSGTVSVGGELVSLTPTSYKLLLVLARWPQRVFSRSELVGLMSARVSERTIDAHVWSLRRQLRQTDAAACIETVRGAGYRLAMEQ